MPSKVDFSKGTCIDNMYVKTNFNSNNLNSSKLMEVLTDHYSLFLNINLCNTKKQSDNVSHKILDFKLLTKQCSKEKWNSILCITNPNEAIEKLIKLIQINMQYHLHMISN